MKYLYFTLLTLCIITFTHIYTFLNDGKVSVIIFIIYLLSISFLLCLNLYGVYLIIKKKSSNPIFISLCISFVYYIVIVLPI